MESYKPLVTTKELKKLCKRAIAKHDTPLAQAREVVNKLTKLRTKKPIKYNNNEWQDDPNNKYYMRIARDYHNRRLARIRKRKEEKQRND